MKTIVVALTAALLFVSLPVNSKFIVNFGVEVKIEKHFSTEELNLNLVKGEVKKGQTILIGNHEDYLLAMRDKHLIHKETGHKGEIKASFRNTEITLDEAFTLMNDMNYIEKEGGTISSSENNDFYYTIEVLTNEIQTLDKYLNVCPELEKFIEQKDENVFLIGKINSHKKAIAIQSKFSEAGLNNNIIVAYEGKKQVPVYLVARAN